MFTKTKEDAKKLFDTANDKVTQDLIRIHLTAELELAFITLIQDMAKQRNYKVGESIYESDLKQISSLVKPMLAGLGSKLANKKREKARDQESRAQYETLPSLLAATDYLFAFAMNELGCPDIPKNFGTDVEDKICEIAATSDNKVLEQDYSLITTDNFFDAQRKINAKTLESNFKILGNHLTNKSATPLDVAKYAAEYQALRKRQENHTSLWRFFHRGENKKRNELLAQMKKTLKGALGASALIETAAPEQLAKEYHARTIKENMAKESDPNGICRRCGNFDTSRIGHEPIENPDRNSVFDYLYNRPNEDLNKSLKEDLKEDKNTELSNKVNEEIKPQVIDKGAISN